MLLSCLWSPAEIGLTSWLSCVTFLVFLSLFHIVPRVGVVLNCIVFILTYIFSHALSGVMYNVPVS